MIQSICISLCSKCGAGDPVVSRGLELLLQRFPALEVEEQGCLFSCDLPAVLIGDQQFIARTDDPQAFTDRIAAWLEAQP